jgi:hypothetical protein
LSHSLFSRKWFQFFPINYELATGLSYIIFIMLKNILFVVSSVLLLWRNVEIY